MTPIPDDDVNQQVLQAQELAAVAAVTMPAG
jgi:hypothetical protein